MNREEIRKKWKNRELAAVSQKKLARQEDTQTSPTKQVVSQGSSWERVQNMANQIMTRNRELVNVQNPLLNQRLQKNNALQDFSNTQRKFNENDVKNKTNKEKNILSKGKDYAGEIGRSLGFGIVEPFANIGSMAYNFPTKLGNALGLETVQQRNAKMGKGISPEEFTDTVKEIENLENERVSQLGTGLRTASRWSRVIGNMIPSILIGQGLAVGDTPEAIQKSASAISSFTSALNSGASTYNETLNEEQDNFLKAGLKASLYGLATKKIEGITGGNIINKFGSLDDIATKGISKVAKNELQKKILSSVYAALGETGEENLENWTDHLIDYAFGDAKDITAQSLLEEAKQTSIDTTAVNFIMQLLGMGGGTYNDVKLYEAEQKIDSANFLNENQKSAMKEVLQENGNPNVADYLLANQLQKVQQNQATTTPNNKILNQEQQTIQEEGKQAQNRLSQETEGIKQKVLNLRQSIDNFNNTRTEGQEIFDINNEETRKEIEAIQKVVEDRNINIRFDENRFKDNSQNAFYEYDENGNVANIILNPNSTTKKYVENLAIHELVHSFSGNKKANLMKEVVNYTKTLEGYDKAYQDIKSNYEKVYGKNVSEDVINEEVVANILGEKLGSKEFVNDLVNGKYSTQNRNFVQKIYDFVKNQINRFKGYKNQEQYWTHIKELFDDAYRNSEVSKEGLKQSVETNKDKIQKHKEEQLEIVKETNPMWDEEHVGIRKVEDIQTFEECIKNAEEDGAFVWGDYTEEDAKRDLARGKVTIYSSYPIKNGVFVSTSYQQAYEYAGHDASKVHQKTVKLDSVAWINGDEGQYAKVKPKVDENKAYQKMIDDVANSLRVTNKTNELDIYAKARQLASNEFKKLTTDEDYDNYNKRIEEIEKDLTERLSQEDANIRYSQDTTGEWNNFIEKYFKNEGTGTAIKDMKKLPEMSITKYQEVLDNAKYIPQEDKQNLLSYLEDIKKNKSSLDDFKKIVNDLNENYRLSIDTEQQAENQAEQQENVEQGQEVVEEEKIRKKILNPTEISNLKLEDANTTPELKDKKYKKGTKESNFAENIENDVGFLTEEQKKEILKNDNVKYYAPVTNADTLAKAFNNLNENGQNATYEWYAKDGKNATAEDVATGWILLKQYADKGDTQGMVNVAKKMRDMGTKAGQTVQAFNILSRLTPEGMVAYTQGELQDVYNEMVKGKTKKWIDEHKGDFDLSQEEVAFIMDTMQNLPPENSKTNNYERKVALGQIQKLFTDKIPAEGGKIKAWMRISMLFNPKTQVRNVAGNVGIVPVNAVADFLGSKVDKAVAKKTGVRTLGNPNVKSYLKGAGQGLYQSYNDFKLGINTRGIEGSKFEFGEGKSFKDKGIGKVLNRTENILNFVMDAGDRAFSQASFVNSLNNQMVLNGVDTPTQEMIDIATQEALSRTWNDDNEYTRFVLGIRNGLNKVGTKSYGLGDVLIPFAKTPANLTKAIVDYSPVGLVKSVINGNNLKNAIETGQFTPMQQHKFVDDLGKALAGTMLYVICYALAKAGIATGEADDDKDVKNFMKNSLGINSYSIKIGDKSFTYDWAQPIATPLAIMTNLNKVNKENPDASTLEKALNAINIGTNQIMEQSFMESLNEVLNGNGEITERIQKALLDLPARAVPTFSKQIADLVDSTQRTSFEYGKPLQSSINAVKAKIPFASKTLTPVVDTLGNKVKRYGGENNLFNVFLNPSNMNKGQLSQVGKEIYNIYMQTGDTKVFPVTAPYYINYKGDKITMTSKQKADYQRIAGKYTEEVINKLLSNDSYNSLTDEEKAEVLTNVVNDSNSKAKKDVLNIENKNSNIDLIEKIGSNYYTFKVELKNALDKKRQETGKETSTLNDTESISVLQQGNYSKKEKDLIYKNIINDKDDVYDNLKLLDNNSLACVDAYFDYKTSDFSNDRKDDGTAKGKSITKSGQKKLQNFLNNSNLTYMQKLYLTGVNNSSLNANERAKLKKYIYSLNITEQQRKTMENKLKFTTEMKDGSYKWK